MYRMIYYIYNGDELLGFIYNSDTYYYHKNIFGDIIGILDSNYNEVVTYTYNSCGLLTNKTDTTTINLSTINPFRYRSYYYDEETNLYYLNSRYYNPEWGRFVNADAIINSNYDTISQNLFVYTSNNFINYSDNDGYGLISALKKVVSTVKKIVKTISNKIINVKAKNNAKICTYKISSTKSSAKVCEVNIKNNSIDKSSVENNIPDIYGLPYDHKVSPDGSKERWMDGEGNPFKDRHYTNHGNPKNHPIVPHDQYWEKGPNGNWKLNPKEYLPNDDDIPFPDTETVSKVVIAGGAIYGGYLLVKWGIAIFTAPYTGGGSLIVAGTIP